MKNLFVIAIITAIAGLVGSCSIDEEYSGLSDSYENPKHVHLTYVDVDVSMSPFDDTVQIDAAVENTGSVCKILKPMDPSDTHFDTVLPRWTPLEIYWVIYDKQEDVERTSIPDVYFEGDDIELESLPSVAGKRPKGTMTLSGMALDYIKFSDFYFNGDESVMTLTAADPMNAKLRVHALQTVDGSCETTIAYCKLRNCEDDSDYTAFSYIHVVATLFSKKVYFK